ncbi:XRE family transcriptional regulator [Rhizobium deserti]|uniref:XRE family transcriptional regulator n=1 Tax=Rhizobium deserti TaxID=2547961 RepID=A0A4R5U6D8_9HYPH|nr:helix-turn-helix transcriptional regulator [Rhizobium deserti]TDK29810.1 XRE family transcriptional regulator [Rhizobium deserti]
MTKTLYTNRHKKLVELLIEHRKSMGKTQADVTKALNRHQSYIANIENVDRRVDVIELLDLAEAIGFDPHQVLDAVPVVKN